MSADGLLSSLVSTWLADSRGRALLMSWAVTGVGVTLRAVLQRRKLKKPKKAEEAPPAAATAPPKRPKPIRALLKVAIPKWGTEPIAWGCALSLGIAVRLMVSIKVSSEIGAMGSLLAQRKWPELFQRQLGYALYGLPAALLAAFQKYAATNLAHGLRRRLMGTVHSGLGRTSSLPRVYAQAAPSASELAMCPVAPGAKTTGGKATVADSPVQQATADVTAFATEAVLLFEALFKPLCEVLLSSYSLGSMMGMGPLVQCYAYFLIAGCWTRFVSPSFATMTEKVQQAEGTLLDSHVRVHAYAEEVTMLHAQGAEAAHLDADLATLGHAASHLSFQRFLSESMDGYVLRYLGILSAFTAMLPAVYHGVGARANDDPTEYFLSCLHLLVNVGLALRDLVGAFKVAATARGYAVRVHALYDALDATPTLAQMPAPSAPESSPASALLVLDALSVSAPDGTMLITSLNLQVAKGMRVLLKGPNGAGKSSLLRVLAGVWEAASGKVATLPARDEVSFVTQRAYVPESMTLRALLAYPHAPSSGDAALDDKCLAVLKWAGLDGVYERVGGGGGASLDTPVGKLSGGEMQRVALARLRLRPPSLALLDEATANIEAAFEAKFFEWAAATSLTLVAVSHAGTLHEHFTHELVLGEGRATLRKL